MFELLKLGLVAGFDDVDASIVDDSEIFKCGCSFVKAMKFFFKVVLFDEELVGFFNGEVKAVFF